LAPTSGTIRLGTKVEVAYFDQLREQIDETKSVHENVSETETLLINGQQRHIIGYLEDFLFTPERSRSTARYLSGGERNRLLLARLFSKPSNVLILDEPTNDLDAETLDLLESLIVEYAGTVLLVSHDRAFLNEAVTSTLVFEGDGIVKDYAGGYDDWLHQKRSQEIDRIERPIVQSKPRSPSQTLSSRVTAQPRQRKPQHQRELEELPKRIETLEIEQRLIHEAMAAPEFYRQDGAVITSVRIRLQLIQQELEVAFERWQILDASSQ
jgi:ATP-binding cassette subfamily F protein uup